ncbi:MAG: sodium:alanine symporter family protein [Oscillospiraceae bacterium]|nr:sodium:alanine symporter family protein [Oscillospiraceae bacterium]
MDSFVAWLTKANDWLNGIVWGVPAMVLILGTGLVLTIATRFTQFTHFGHAMKYTIGRVGRKQSTADRGAVTQFQAVCTALAATVGTGNIAGVAGAIALGGPGAVFWMWVAALVGMITKYAEVVLSIKYRQRNDKGDWVGGPMYYIKNGLGKRWKWLAAVFCVLAALASFGIGNIAQINSIAGAVTGAVQVFNADANVQTVCLITGIVVMLVVALISIGGLKRIGQATEMLVPVMSIIYIVACLVVVIGNIGNIGRVFAMIFEGAFQPAAVVGGGLGITVATAMKRGVSRGIFSNEAGLGSAPIAHAAADTDSPVRQGLFGIFEVFADTLVICTLTALTILSSGITIGYGQKAGAELSTAAFSTVFSGSVASVVVAVALTLFALTTILSWNLYGSRCCEYLFGSTKASLVYKILFLPVVVMGATMDLQLAWDISDTLNGLMAIPNLIGVLLLSPVVVKLTREYFAKEKLPKV